MLHPGDLSAGVGGQPYCGVALRVRLAWVGHPAAPGAFLRPRCDTLNRPAIPAEAAGLCMSLTFGTLHVVVVHSDRVVICSDSRGCDIRGLGPIAEDFQKLFQCGEWTACLIGGILMLSPNRRVSTRVAHVCARTALQDSPVELLRAIQNDLYPKFLHLPATPVPNLTSDPPPAFSAYSIRRTRDGRIDMWELRFPVKIDSGVLRFDQPMPPICHFERFILQTGERCAILSHPDCLSTQATAANREHRHLITPGLSNEDLSGEVDKLFEMAMATNQTCNDQVGGPIDVAVIDSSGFRWVRRKPNRPITRFLRDAWRQLHWHLTK